MIIISFAWTTAALKAGLKCVTRRFWNQAYMEKVWACAQRNGGWCQAYDKSPMYGGKLAGYVRLTKKPYLQDLDLVTDEDEIKEGHLWCNAEGYKAAMKPHGQVPYVVEFDYSAVHPNEIKQLNLII
jgi:hypothetical protein